MSEKLKPKNLSNSLTLSGMGVCDLPAPLRWSYCEKISAKLEGPNTVPESPDNLYKAMLEGRAVVTMDTVTSEIYGFAQVKQDSTLPKRWILNSLSSFASGAAKPIVWNAALLVYDIDSKAQVIAKVREGNTKAQKTIAETGGKLIGNETSEHHYNPASLQPIGKEVYDVSFETLIPKKTDVKSSLDIVKEYRDASDAELGQQSNPFVNKMKWLISAAIGFKSKNTKR